jgi:hypothetical protein
METKHIRINHYFTKSKEEWIERRSRGKADTTDRNEKRSLDEFYEHDHNDIYDPIMLPYVKIIKKSVNMCCTKTNTDVAENVSKKLKCVSKICCKEWTKND